jgi:hypothetical protein
MADESGDRDYARLSTTGSDKNSICVARSRRPAKGAAAGIGRGRSRRLTQINEAKSFLVREKYRPY